MQPKTGLDVDDNESQIVGLSHCVLFPLMQHGWQKNLDINLYGVCHGVFTAIDRMGRSKGGKGGRIVNIASVAGLAVRVY